jgi:DNA ligase-4
MGYKGPKASEIDTESNIFEGMHFGESAASNTCLSRMNWSWLVVHADPKSRTGQEDRKQLLTSYALSFLVHVDLAKQFISRIIAQGGKSWNVVKDVENLFVVYGGTTKCQSSQSSITYLFICILWFSSRNQSYHSKGYI